MIFFKIAVSLLCGILDAWGGHNFLPARRFIMPVMLGVSISIVCNVWWLGFVVLPVIGTLCLGYFDPGNAGRALWLFLQAVNIGLGLVFTGHLAWYWFLGYIVIAGILGGIYKNWKQIIGDIVTGSWLGAVIFFVR